MNGPNKWTEMYPAARGKRQSPIDVVTREAAPGQVEEVRVETRPCSLLHLENTGVSWQLHFHDSLTSVISGGALPGHFKIVQVHAHWGQENGCGSEHTVDGRSYDAELHIVHYNSRYSSPGEAFDMEDGLAVLGMLIKIGKHHPEMDKICKKLSEIQNPYEKTQLEEEFDIEKLLPEDRSFFTYPGSLTTPPLYESVTWTLFSQPIEVSESQLAAMRSLKTGSEKKKCLVNNYRPPCDREQRPVLYHRTQA